MSALAAPDAAAEARRLRNLLSLREPLFEKGLQVPLLERSLATYRVETSQLYAALAVPHTAGMAALRAERDDLAAAVKVAKLHIGVTEASTAEAEARAVASEKVVREMRKKVEMGEKRVREMGEQAEKKEEHGKRVAAANRTLTRALEVERAVGVKVKAAGSAREKALERRVKIGEEEALRKVGRVERERQRVERERDEKVKEVGVLRKRVAGLEKKVEEKEKECAQAVREKVRLEREWEKETVLLTREVRKLEKKVKREEENVARAEEARDALKVRMKDAVTRARDAAGVAATSATKRWMHKFERATAEIEDQAREIRELRDKLAVLEEIHKEYTLPPASIPREDFSALLSPAPLAPGRNGTPTRAGRGTPARVGRGATLSRTGKSVTPMRLARVDDAASESRSRFTDTLPFPIDGDDIEEEEAEDNPTRGRAKKSATTQNSGRAVARPKTAKNQTRRRKRSAVEDDEDATDAEDIINGELRDGTDGDGDGADALSGRKSPAVKRRKVSKGKKKAVQPSSPLATRAAPSPQVAVVERRAGGRALRSRRPVSYDYDKDGRDIVGKSPGYEVDLKALRPRRVARSRVAKALDFDVAAATSGAEAAAEVIRRTVRQRRAHAVRKTVGS